MHIEGPILVKVQDLSVLMPTRHKDATIFGPRTKPEFYLNLEVQSHLDLWL